MFFKKKKEATRKIDKLVTTFIIGGAVAGMIGLSQTKKGKEVTGKIEKKTKNIFEKTHTLFGKTMVKFLDIINKK